MQIQEKNLEIRGISKNLKVERRIERIYRKHCAALLIQRTFRGHKCRQRIKQQIFSQKDQALATFAETLATLMAKGVERIQKSNLKGLGFQAIKFYSVSQFLKTHHLEKIILIQNWARKQLEVGKANGLQKLQQKIELAASPQKISKIGHPALTARPHQSPSRNKAGQFSKSKSKKAAGRSRNQSTPVKQGSIA